jgi:flagellar FliL protein
MADAVDGEMPKKKSGMVMTIVAVVIVTVIAGAGGWFLGTFLSPIVNTPKKPVPPPEAAAEGKKPDEGLPMLTAEETGVVQLEPILTNLAYPSTSWVRLEVALMFKDKPDPKIAEAVHQDIMLYMRTVTLQQIEGPRGFQYLKDDIQDRADQISEGKLSKILFRTFVVE